MSYILNDHAENVEALDLYGLCCDQGRGCPRNGGAGQRARDKAAQLRKRDAQEAIVAKRPPPEVESGEVIVKAASSKRCSIM